MNMRQAKLGDGRGFKFQAALMDKAGKSEGSEGFRIMAMPAA